MASGASGASDRPAAGEWRRNGTVVLAGMAGMSLASLPTSTIGVMVVPIEREFGWPRAEIASGPMLLTLVVFCSGLFAGLAIDRFGPRRIGIGAVLLSCGTIAAMSRLTDSIWAWRGLWVLIGFASAAMPTVWLKPVAARFNAGRGLALSLVLCGSGISSTLVPPLANALVEQHGWRTAYLILAAIWVAVVLPLIVLFLRMPAGATPATSDASGEVAPESLPGLTAREGFRSRKFALLLLGTIAGTFLGTGLVLYLVPILRSTGISSGAAATIAGFTGLASIAGRLAGGVVMDRVNARFVAAGAVLMMMVLPTMLLAFPGSAAASTLGVVSYGLAGGALIPAIAYLVNRHMGQRSFGTFYATINAMQAIGVGIGPLLSNMVYDRVHSYMPVYWATLPLFVIAALLFLALGPYAEFSGNEKRA